MAEKKRKTTTNSQTKKTSTAKSKKLSEQVEDNVKSKKEESTGVFKPPEGNFEKMTHTGSTLFDLALTGGKIRGGGFPSGITVEVYGAPSLGKTALLCSIGGRVEDNGGETKYEEPEARLSKGFAEILGYTIDASKIDRPNTPEEMFSNLRNWKPKDPKAINAFMVDSLAAFASKQEMDDKKDEYSQVAKSFARGLRVNSRMIADNNYIFICSNQIRDNVGVTFGEKTKAAGGWAFKFFGSLRLRAVKRSPYKIMQTSKYKGKDYERPIGTSIEIIVEKSSVWKPYRTAPIDIIFDYGIDDIRANLRYVKQVRGISGPSYYIGKTKLAEGMEDSIAMVEEDNLERKLREEVINLWEEIESMFQTKRKPKK